MKNEDIHKDLSETEVRNFLAKQYQRTLFQGVIFGSVSRLEKELKELQKALDEAKAHDAVRQLIHNQGWAAWDVSDEVPYNRNTYFPFVGTEEEYEALLKAISDS